MEIQTTDIDNGQLITPMGDIDMNTSVELRKTLQKCIKQKTGEIVVTLQKVNYIDSSGLATLIECLQESQKYGGKLKLVVEKQQILDVFKLARLDSVFKIYPNQEAAISA